MSQPRCCAKDASEFDPCYASVLVYGSSGEGLKDAVADLERGLVSCFVGRCSRCRVNYLLSTDADQFPTLSAHHTHKIALLSYLRQNKLFPV
jgi:hypothetical protein